MMREQQASQVAALVALCLVYYALFVPSFFSQAVMVFAPFWLLARLVFYVITWRTIWTACCVGLGVLAHRVFTALAEPERERNDKEGREADRRADSQIKSPTITQTGEEVHHVVMGQRLP